MERLKSVESEQKVQEKLRMSDFCKKKKRTIYKSSTRSHKYVECWWLQSFLCHSKSERRERTSHWYCSGGYITLDRTLFAHHVCGEDFQMCWFLTTHSTYVIDFVGCGANSWLTHNHHVGRHHGTQILNSNIIDWFSRWTFCHGNLWLSQTEWLQSIILHICSSFIFVTGSFHFSVWYYTVVTPC